MDGGEPKSDFELSLLSRLNTLKPASTTQTLDRRRPSAASSQPSSAGARSRTTEDMRSRGPSSTPNRQPSSSGGALSFQEELMKKRTKMRGGPPPSGTSANSMGNNNVGTNGGTGEQGKREPPMPARLPSGKKKVPMPPTAAKSGKSEENPEKPSWGGTKKTKVSDLASKLNFNSGPTTTNNQQDYPGSRNSPSAVPPVQPKLKPTPKSGQPAAADSILQRLSDRAQSSGNGGRERQGGGRRFDGSNVQPAPPPPAQAPAPASTPCNYEDPTPQFAPKQHRTPPDTASSPPSLKRGPGNGSLRRKASFQQNAEQNSRAQNEAEAPPPVIPKRMESFKKESFMKPPKWPQDDLLKMENQGESVDNHSQTSRSLDSQARSGSRKKTSGGRLPSNGSPRLPEKSSSITPVGSSSESDYSGDGRVRR